MDFGDVFSGGVNDLCMVDLSSCFDFKTKNESKTKSYTKLRVLQGLEIKHEVQLVEPACGVASFNVIVGGQVLQDLAVAGGPFIYIYRKLKPYYKFSLPLLDLDPREESAWEDAKASKLTAKELRDNLNQLKCEKCPLTPRSARYLRLPPSQLCEFYEAYRNVPLQRQTVATCLGKLLRQQSNVNSAHCLVVGTEEGCLYILDPTAFNILAKTSLPSPPAHVSVSGSYDIEYRIVVACRNGLIYQIKRGTTEVSEGIDPGSQAVSLVRPERTIIVGCMDQTIKGFSLKGRPMWSIRQTASILAMTSMLLPSHTIAGYIVSFSDGRVCAFREQHICDTIIQWSPIKQKWSAEVPTNQGNSNTGEKVQEMDDKSSAVSTRPAGNPLGNESCWPQPDPVVACICGQYDREAGSLVLNTRSGALMVLLVKRSATFAPLDVLSGRPVAQLARLDIPKKSKLFIDLAVREKKNAAAIHKQFTSDLAVIRRTVARTFVELLETRSGPVAIPGANNQLRLTARLHGFGCLFVLAMDLIQIHTDNTLGCTGLSIVLNFDDTVYQVKSPCIQLPLIISGVTYRYTTTVKAIRDTRASNTIRILVISPHEFGPLLTATVEVPETDIMNGVM